MFIYGKTFTSNGGAERRRQKRKHSHFMPAKVSSESSCNGIIEHPSTYIRYAITHKEAPRAIYKYRVVVVLPHHAIDEKRGKGDAAIFNY